NEDTHAVCELEQFRCGWVVRGAYRVGAHLLHHLELALRRAIVEGRTERAEIVMQVHALKRDPFAVDDDAAIGIEAHGADAETGFLAIDNLLPLRKCGDGDVAVRLLLRHRPPQPRVIDASGAYDARAASCSDA